MVKTSWIKNLLVVLVLLLGTVNVSMAQSLLINEVLYNPDSYKHEFVEIYNNGVSSIDLTGYEFSDGIFLDFPDGTTIAAGEYIVCVRDIEEDIWDGVSFQIFEFGGAVGDSSDSIVLEDASENVVDSIEYIDEYPWPDPLFFDEDWYSIELLYPALDNNNGNNWAGSLVAGGTPGAANSDHFTFSGTVAGDKLDAININLVRNVCGTDYHVTTVITDASGNFTVSGLDNGLYYIVPVDDSCSFESEQLTVKIPLEAGGEAGFSGPFDFVSTCE